MKDLNQILREVELRNTEAHEGETAILDDDIVRLVAALRLAVEQRNNFAAAMAIALDYGLFPEKAAVKAKLEKILGSLEPDTEIARIMNGEAE